KTDHQNFYKEYFAAQLQKRIALLIILPLLVGYVVSSVESFKWSIFIIGCFITFVILFSILYLIPYLRSIRYLNRVISKNSTYSEKRKLSTTETGLIIQSISKTAELNWESINAIDSTKNYI